MNKKHHYVPKFYLKRFSSCKKNISLYNIPNKTLVKCASLRNQCYEDHFYGPDTEVEKNLSSVEQKASSILRTIVDTLKLPNNSDYKSLLFFVLLQHSRTKFAAKCLEETIDKIAKEVVLTNSSFSSEFLSQFKITCNEPGIFSLYFYLKWFPLIVDLALKILIINNNNIFITSDNPVVLHNDFMNFRKFTSNIGLACRGLQIFLPIDSKHMLYFYDPATYKVGNRKDHVIDITNSTDVLMLNELQVASSLSNIYWNEETKFEVKELHKSMKLFLKAQKSRLTILKEPNESRELIITSKQENKTPLPLSFSKITRKAQKFRSKIQDKPSQPSMILRNPEFVKDYQNEYYAQAGTLFPMP